MPAKIKSKRSPLRKLVITLLFSLVVSGLLLAADFLFPFPWPEDPYATIVTAEDGSPLRAFADSDGVWRYPVDHSQVSEQYLQALLHYEDRWFYWHPGFNPIATARALVSNLQAGRIVSGGSTLTMQVARILDPHARSIPGKMKQVLRAMQLEWHLSKWEILNLYLNYAPFGGNIEGVQAASFTYLGKSADTLTDAEAALLAVLPQAPSRYRPDRHPEIARQARDKVLDRLAGFSVWSNDRVTDAKLESVSALSFSMPFDAPHLTRRLRFSHPNQSRLDTLIDLNLQLQLEDLAQQFGAQLPAQQSVSILLVENSNLAVRAYVGSADFHDVRRAGQVDMVNAIRSPGSTLKPFAYGLAIDQGIVHSKSLLSDTPRTGAGYQPGNFTRGFSGPVALDTALRQSLNVPAVQVLEAYGPQKFYDKLAHTGARLSLRGSANLAIVLGGLGTDLQSLVSLYTSLANQGQVGQLRYLQGEPQRQRHLLTPGAAWVVRNILEQPLPGFEYLQRVTGSKNMAWKTGTSYGHRDAWAIAVTDEFTLGVWVGRPDGSPSPGQFGAATAVPLLSQAMEILADSNAATRSFKRPNTVVNTAICWPSGFNRVRHSTDPKNCHQTHEAWIVRGQTPPTLINEKFEQGALVKRILVNMDNGKWVDRRCQVSRTQFQQVAVWPLPLEPWLPWDQRRHNILPKPDPRCATPPSLADQKITITHPQSGTRFASPPDNPKAVEIEFTSLGAVGQITWFLNGQQIAEGSPRQTLPWTFDHPGKYQLAVVDEAGHNALSEFEVLPWQ